MANKNEEIKVSEVANAFFKKRLGKFAEPDTEYFDCSLVKDKSCRDHKKF